MVQNFMNIAEKGNYFIITTGWVDLEQGRENYTGQFDFPKDATSFLGYKNLEQAEIYNTGVSIICGMPYKRLNMRAEMLTTDGDGNPTLIPNSFRIDGTEVPFDDFVVYLYMNTGGATTR